jgi:putative serine protease PepD
VGGWVWPVVALLALVVGVIGGVVGAAGFRIVDEATDSPALVSEGLGGVDLATEAPLEAEDGTVANVAAAVLPSTVQIIAAYGGDDQGATGSGFVLDRQGHVVTNNHVVAEAADDGGRIQVVDQDGNRFEASVVGRSAVYDLAVLVADGMAGEYEPTSLGASSKLRVGETVVAIGSPLGLSSTVTAGIVSALQRPVTTGDPDSQASYINAVQTDAAINPGNSGGPLVNLLGQVVGVNSAIATTGGGFGSSEAGNIGVGFAIPVEQVRITADQILRTGEAQYPVIGAQVRTGSDDGSGAEIQKVNAGSPAEVGGLEEGDVVVAVDGARVTDGISLIVSIRTHQPGEEIEFTVDRDGQQRTVTVELDGEIG